MNPSGGCVALTGGTGFLGPHIAAALQSAGWRVRYLSRRHRAALPADGTVLGSLDDTAALDALLDGADAVVHAAGTVKATTDAEFFRVNRDGSRNLAEAIKRQGRALPMVVVSSLAAREPGLSPYAASKRGGEDAFRDASLAPVFLRPTAVYGPGDVEAAVLIRAADGFAMPFPRFPGRVTMIHAADVARAVAAMCAAEGVAGRTFELTDARADGYGWRELAEAIRFAAGSRARIVGLPRPLVAAAAACAATAARVFGRATMLTPAKVREIFHPDWSSAPERQPPTTSWQPRIGLAEGLADTISWLRANANPPSQGRFHHAG